MDNEKEKWSETRKLFEKWCDRVSGIFKANGAGLGTGIIEDTLICELGKGSVTLQIYPQSRGVQLLLIDYPDYPMTDYEEVLIEGKVPIEELKLETGEKLPETKPELPEGVEVVKYEFVLESDAITAENLFSVIIAKKGEFRSAVNLGTKVRTVMYELDKEGKAIGGGSALVMETVSKDNAWHLQQMIDWAYRTIVEIIAVKKMDKTVEVAFMMKGLKVLQPKEKEKLFFSFKKTDRWKLEGKPMR